jgi:hypothetical protein
MMSPSALLRTTDPHRLDLDHAELRHHRRRRRWRGAHDARSSGRPCHAARFRARRRRDVRRGEQHASHLNALSDVRADGSSRELIDRGRHDAGSRSGRRWSDPRRSGRPSSRCRSTGRRGARRSYRGVRGPAGVAPGPTQPISVMLCCEPGVPGIWAQEPGAVRAASAVAPSAIRTLLINGCRSPTSSWVSLLRDQIKVASGSPG